VDDSTLENGCLRVIPGTQNTDLTDLDDYEHPETPNVLDSGINPDTIDESKAVDLILKAGDVSIHHPNVIHGSNANTSPKWRRGLTIRYIPTSTRIISEGVWPSAFLLRGEAVPGVNTYHPWPKYIPGEHMPFAGAENWR
jgi:phytanoyl-CoA hydroxylase